MGRAGSDDDERDVGGQSYSADMTDLRTDAGWRLLDGSPTAWFAAGSLTQSAAFGARVVELAPEAAVDVRPTGARVRLSSDEHTGEVSTAARDLGLVPDPAALQHVSVVLESTDPSAVRPFWQSALGHDTAPDGRLVDPWRRDPAFEFRDSTEVRPLRNRIHVDVVRPAEVVERAGLGEASGPYGVCHTDADGNEVDLVPGDPLEESGTPPEATADWRAVFAAQACYRVGSPAQQRDVVAAVAELADEAGFPLLVDLRPGLVVLDSGKDQWEADAHGLDVDFTALAARLQSAAREQGGTVDVALPRLVQLVLDAADVPALRAFWAAALGYVPDRRAGVTDLVDPRRLNPVVLFQDLDVTQTQRQLQRNRLHVELEVPADLAVARVAAAVEAGGRLLDQSPGRWLLADPESNELVVVAGA